MAARSPVAPKPRLTLKDVAAVLGVSRTAVSNAFNRPEELSHALRADILAKARELGYFGPDPAARALRSREVRQVAVVFGHDLGPVLGDPISVQFLRGVAEELDARGMSMQLIPKMGRTSSLANAFQTTADALIVHAEVELALVPEVRASGKPLVLVDAVVADVPSVRVDDRAGAASAMEHALSRRPDRVLVLSFEPADPARMHGPGVSAAGTRAATTQRSRGYVSAARRLGFDLDRIDWLEMAQPFEPDRLIDYLKQLPGRTRLAVMGTTDTAALAGLQVLKGNHRIDVVSVVGFDDIPAAAAAGLTTMRQDSALKGQLAVRQLLDGGKSDPLPFELVVRET